MNIKLKWYMKVLTLVMLYCQLLYKYPLQAAESSQAIRLFVNSIGVETAAMNPIQWDGYTLVPAREVFQELGAEVLWKPSEQKVYVNNGASLIILAIDQTEAWVDAKEAKLPIPAKIINGKVMIPTRFVAETLGYEVIWHGTERIVEINAPVPIIPEEKPEEDKNEQMVPPIKEEQEAPTIDDMWEESEDLLEEEYCFDEWVNEEHIIYLEDVLEESETIELIGIKGLEPQNIIVEENYHQKEIIIQLDEDYSAKLPQGRWEKKKGAIKGIQIKASDEGTQIILTTNSIRALVVTREGDKISLKCVAPNKKYSKIIVLDAGHGDHDPGTHFEGIKEKDLTLQFGLALQEHLKNSLDIKVYMTREDDSFVTLAGRAEMANEIEPDLFISLHVNSAENKLASGVETFYTPKPDERNKIFAQMVQQALVEQLGAKDRGVKSNTFVVTRLTNAPAILIEIGFLSNVVDREMITDPYFVERYADILYGCILEYYRQGFSSREDASNDYI